MANPEQLARLKRSVGEWNQWRRDQPDILTDLTGANISGVNISGANLSRAFLTEANLSYTNLSMANLSMASLTETNLTGANLTGANLTGADLLIVNFTKANLSGINLTNTTLGNTTFVQNDLSTTKGLAQIEHIAESYVSLHTIKLPQDSSALHFLRGTGIPDEWIDVYQNMTMKPIRYYSCFISHSSSDKLLAQRLHTDLQNREVQCWFAPHDLRPGQLIRKGIDEAIYMQDKLLLILSEHSVESEWVSYEVETALNREIRQKREILFPIRIDDAIFRSRTDWAYKLQMERHIGDFTQWSNPEHYQHVLERLLRDLKAQT